MKKISQKSDDFFTVRSYLLNDGADAIGSWYDKQSEEIQADFLVALKHLREMPQKWWRRRRFEEMGKRGQRECVGLGRIRVWSDDGDEAIHFRILTCFGPGSHDLTMLMVFNKDDDPDYKISCPEAQARKQQVENDKNRTRECPL